MKIIRQENGQFIYEGTIQEDINSYYTIMFERNLLEKTNNYYKAKALELINHPTPEYVIEIQKILKNFQIVQISSNGMLCIVLFEK